MSLMQLRGPILNLGADLWAVSAWRGTFDRIPDLAASVRLDVSFDIPLERFVVDEVLVSAPDGAEVTGAMLREIRVAELVQQAAPWFIWLSDPAVSMTSNSWGWKVLRDVKPIAGRATAKDVLTAARVYRLASIATLPPLKTVAEKLGVSQSTATRLVAKARAEGHTLTGLGPDFGIASQTPTVYAQTFESSPELAEMGRRISELVNAHGDD